MKYQNILSENVVQCTLCPRLCKLKRGQKGFCFVRENKNNEIILNTYGFNTGLGIDPIEKKPLYHFYPNKPILSFGTTGCNMGCIFCQNYKTSKSKIDPKTLNKTEPFQIVEILKKYNVNMVAFTYNEPVIFFEYALDVAKLCKEENIKTVMVTSGYMNIEPAREIYKYIDAANIDLKGFSEEFYNKNCYASLKPVLELIKFVKNETNCHVELTTMLIEKRNDTLDMIKKEADWIIKNAGENTPLHFSAFFPNYKLKNIPPTNFETLFNARKTAIVEGLNYVYTGNLSTIETSTTFCKNCRSPLIVRDGYKIKEYNLEGNKCKKCKTILDGCF